MRTIQLRHLIDLVASNVEKGEAGIEKVFQWHFERDIAIVKWALGLAASLFIATLIAYFRANSGSSGASASQYTVIELLGAMAIAASSATYGIYRMVRLRKLQEQYIAALTLYGRLKVIREFIQSYRRLS